MRGSAFDTTKLHELVGGPTLLNLWQRTCIPCLQELRDFADHGDQLSESGIRFLTLYASDPEFSADKNRQAVAEMIDRLDLPFDAVRTVGKSIEILDEFQDQILQKHRSIVMPTSFLLDAEMRVVAVYKGRIDVAQVIEDAKLITMNDDDRLRTSLPFAGKWFQRPDQARN